MQYLTYETLATVGLAMDMVGVVMLFYFGMPPRMKPPKEQVGGPYFINPYSLIATAEGSAKTLEDADVAWLNRWKRKRNVLSYLAITLVVVGFGLQIWAILL